MLEILLFCKFPLYVSPGLLDITGRDSVISAGKAWPDNNHFIIYFLLFSIFNMLSSIPTTLSSECYLLLVIHFIQYYLLVFMKDANNVKRSNMTVRPVLSGFCLVPLTSYSASCCRPGSTRRQWRCRCPAWWTAPWTRWVASPPKCCVWWTWYPPRTCWMMRNTRRS